VSEKTRSSKYHLNKRSILRDNYEELVQLATFLLTDGGMIRKRSTFVVYFTNKSVVLNRQFKRIVRELLPNAHFSESVHKGVTRNYVHCKELGELMYEVSNTYRTTPCESYPACSMYREKPEQRPCSVCIKKYDEENKAYPDATLPIVDDEILQKEMLRIIADTEGSATFLIRRKPTHIRLKREVVIACNHPTLRKQIMEALFDLEILSRYCLGKITIEGHAIKKFNEKIGFSKGVKVSKGIYKGYDKQSVLEIMVLTNKLIKDKRIYPGEIKNLEETLRKCIEIYDQTYSRLKVIDFLINC
jgi:hypothetical protein